MISFSIPFLQIVIDRKARERERKGEILIEKTRERVVREREKERGEGERVIEKMNE